jgi:glycogen synthase
MQQSPLNIALFPSSFHPHMGGVEQVALQLAHEQRAQGHNPLIITNRWPKTLPATEDVEGLKVHRHVFRVPERTWRQFGGAVLYGPGTMRTICAQLRAHQTDVVHVHCVSSNAHYALSVRRRLGLPLVATLHAELTMDANRLFQRSAFARNLLRRVLTEADAITACSARTLSDAVAFFGRPLGDKAHVIYNGVRAADFDAGVAHPHERPYFFALGRLVKQKGFDVLIEAMACGELSSHDLLLAGEGPELEALKHLALTRGIAERIQFVGRADRTQVIGLFKGCDVFVLPSRADEGLPVVAIESLAAGKPAVASSTGGTPEVIVHNSTGLLVERDDASVLRTALIQMVRDPLMRARFGAAARERAEQFKWRAIADQYADVYEQARTRARLRKAG